MQEVGRTLLSHHLTIEMTMSPRSGAVESKLESVKVTRPSRATGSRIEEELEVLQGLLDDSDKAAPDRGMRLTIRSRPGWRHPTRHVPNESAVEARRPSQVARVGNGSPRPLARRETRP